MAEQPVSPLWVEMACWLVMVVVTLALGIPLLVPALLGALWWTYMATMTRWSFRAPSKRKQPITSEAWASASVDTTVGLIQLYHSAIKPDAPLVFACHGWSSGSVRMTDRVQPFLDRGFNAVLVDLPSHGASATLPYWSAEGSVTLVVQALNHLVESWDLPQPIPVVFLGHSMGGFVGFRMSKRRQELHPSLRFKGWVMESPMTGYTEIFEETCRMLNIPNMFRRSLEHRVLKRFQQLNPATTDIARLGDADIPEWGSVQEPCLLVQADPDDRLGSTHHQRLVRVASQSPSSALTVHMLPTLTHSGSHEHPLRNRLVGEWIDSVMLN